MSRHIFALTDTGGFCYTESMSSDFAPFEEFEHAADLGLRVRGRTLEDLFANAAEGMLRSMAGDLSPCLGGQERLIEIEGLDQEHLLVRWLSEILYIFREGLAAAGVEFETLGATKLRARCLLQELPAGLKPHREIKLVTHHAVSIERKDGLYVAEVVFDV